MVLINNGGYVGIGTTTPTRQLEIVQTQLGDGSLDGFFVRDSSNIQANFAIKGGTGASSPRIMVSSLSDSLGGGIGGTGLIVNYVDNNNFYPLRFLGSRVDFETTSSSYGSRTTIMRANPTGVLINTTTDAGYKLDVNGDFRTVGDTYLSTSSGTTSVGAISQAAKFYVRGSGSTSASRALMVENSSQNGRIIFSDDRQFIIEINDTGGPTHTFRANGSHPTYSFNSSTTVGGVCVFDSIGCTDLREIWFQPDKTICAYCCSIYNCDG
jgi:hypothetical protein